LLLKEKSLKELFISSLKSGHIYGDNYCLPHVDSNCELSIKEEGYFRNFDLVVAIREKLCRRYETSQRESSDFSADHMNIVMRSGLFTKFALKEKCRIDSVAFYPVEIKSDRDSLDERLAHQVLNALLFFGRSIVVLDTKHCKEKGVLKLCRYLPATFLGYTGKEDYFNVISTFDRFISTNIYFLRKRSLAKLLVNNGVEVAKVHKIYRCLENIQRINQKIAFSQVNFDGEVVLLPEELEFIKRLVDVSLTPNTRVANKLIKNSINTKITDFL
jgi:hypothetical protein